MSGRSAALGAWLAVLLCTGSPEAVAGPVARLLHVCDCPPPAAAAERGELLAALSRLGYVQGKDLDLVTHDVTTAQAPYAEFLRREVATRRPDLVLASGVRVAEAAKAATAMPPVVFWRLTDPVGHGLVTSLAQPGGNLTGYSAGIEKLTAKRLELLHEMLPRARRVGFVFLADWPSHAQQAAEVQTVARAIGVEVLEYSLPESRWSEQPLDELFSRMRRERVEAILLPDLNVYPKLVSDLAARYRFPTIHSLTHVVTEWGGLAAYSTATADSVRVVAGYADRILRGAKPADLPVQEPQLYEFVLNEGAARDLGVSFSPASRLRATRIVSN